MSTSSLDLELLEQQALLSALDVQLARALARLGGESDARVLLAVALASRQVRFGHVCLDLRALCEGSLAFDLPETSLPSFPAYPAWRAALERSPLLTRGEPSPPLHLDARGRLYLQRYRQKELQVARVLRERARSAPPPPDEIWLESALDRLFPETVSAPSPQAPPKQRKPSASKPDDRQLSLGLEPEQTPETTQPGARDQRDAVELALRSRLTVVTGGPGTGKTFMVVRLLALLVEQALARGEPAPSMALLAPTGKAAARLSEAILKAKQDLPCAPKVLARISSSTSTVHRALASSRSRSISASELLPADVVVVDEASMVDLSLMAALLARTAHDSRIVLLGDRDQLASVEAGAVLGDLCRVSESQAARAHAPQLAKAIAVLRRPFRYKAGGHIARLAGAVRDGDSERVLSLLREPSEEVRWVAPELPDGAAGGAQPGLDQRLLREAAHAYGPLFSSAPVGERLACLSRYRVLCAHRLGRFGAVTANLEIERMLRTLGILRSDSTRYDGKPIMVVENDYDVKLYNGDVGILLRDDRLRAAFPSTDASHAREISLARVPSHESVYAMTVHKSQGSEADEVAVVLPIEPSRIVSRELLYTAITRARERVVLYATDAAVAKATTTAVQRSTGLLDALASAPEEPS